MYRSHHVRGLSHDHVTYREACRGLDLDLDPGTVMGLQRLAAQELSIREVLLHHLAQRVTIVLTVVVMLMMSSIETWVVF